MSSEDKMITVFNLTDVPTSRLEQYGLSNTVLAVGRVLVAPGEKATTVDDVVTRNGLQHYTSVGAIAVDTLPSSYIVAKEKMKGSLPPIAVPPAPVAEVAAEAPPVSSKKDSKKG